MSKCKTTYNASIIHHQSQHEKMYNMLTLNDDVHKKHFVKHNDYVDTSIYKLIKSQHYHVNDIHASLYQSCTYDDVNEYEYCMMITYNKHVCVLYAKIQQNFITYINDIDCLQTLIIQNINMFA